MNFALTKDADKTLCEIYTHYLNRRDDGIDRKTAKDFYDKSNWPDPDWLTPDGRESLSELKRAGMIRMDIFGGFCLEDNAVLYMESRFKRGVAEVLEHLAALKAVIPFV